jgi:hypothetical protein
VRDVTCLLCNEAKPPVEPVLSHLVSWAAKARYADFTLTIEISARMYSAANAYVQLQELV